MNDEKPPLSAAIRHLADRQRRALTEHPTAAELTAYHAGELPSEAEARLREHLALCRDCSDLSWTWPASRTSLRRRACPS